MVYRVEVMVLKGFRQLNCLKKDFFWRSLCFEYTIPCRRRRETLLWWIFKLIFNHKRGTNDRKECYLEESQMLPGNAVRGDRKYWHRSTQHHLKIQGNLSIIIILSCLVLNDIVEAISPVSFSTYERRSGSDRSSDSVCTIC